jgi:hypothetical protein
MMHDLKFGLKKTKYDYYFKSFLKIFNIESLYCPVFPFVFARKQSMITHIKINKGVDDKRRDKIMVNQPSFIDMRKEG